MDTRSVLDFVRAELPPPPARVLEAGCGDGALTRALAEAGWDALGIDPAAPDGPLFRRITLADLDEEASFDGVVAVRVLNQVTDVERALDRVRALLRPGGVLVVDGFAWDRLDGPTAEWFHGQRRALAAAGRLPEAPATAAETAAEWEAHHVGLNGFEMLRDALDARFRERSFSWVPGLYRYLDGVAAEPLERMLLETDAIQAVGFRYVGLR